MVEKNGSRRGWATAPSAVAGCDKSRCERSRAGSERASLCRDDCVVWMGNCDDEGWAGLGCW